MKILFIDAYFHPEKIAFSHLERDILNTLIEGGNEIDVICPTPTRGIPESEAKKYRKIKSERVFGVNVTRFWAPYETRNPILRAARYLWCNLRTYNIAKKIKNVDVIFAASTPPTQGFLAARIEKKNNCRFIYSLQDIFPDSLVNAGMAKRDGILWKIGRRIEDHTYRNADKIIVISEDFKENILKKGVSEDKIEVIPNWIDTDKVFPVSKMNNNLYGELHIDKDKFTVVYAGNFGASQGADIIIKAAEILKEKENIQFVVFGSGSEFETVKEYAGNGRIKNLKLFDLMPIERVSDVYSLGDVAIITCKKGVGKSAMPSKTWSIMACNIPILASFDKDSALNRLLKQTEAGICIDPEDAGLLADTIVKLYNREISFSLTGRKYVCENASKNMCLKKYKDVFEGAV